MLNKFTQKLVDQSSLINYKDFQEIIAAAFLICRSSRTGPDDWQIRNAAPFLICENDVKRIHLRKIIG